ncbi:hypothetical protein AAVH_16372 [Aphelenchoides avenae]|nr:hypothetical protein AAVH_16372 [Aphelenchus avenae]
MNYWNRVERFPSLDLYRYNLYTRFDTYVPDRHGLYDYVYGSNMLRSSSYTSLIRPSYTNYRTQSGIYSSLSRGDINYWDGVGRFSRVDLYNPIYYRSNQYVPGSYSYYGRSYSSGLIRSASYARLRWTTFNRPWTPTYYPRVSFGYPFY